MDNPYKEIFDALRKSSQVRRTEDLKCRIRRIKAIELWTLEHRQEIRDAVYKDLGKPADPADISEVFTVATEARNARRNLKRWSRARKVDAPLTHLGTTSVVKYEPRGVCLLISPWNFPYNLAIIPLISCLAAGNVAIMKPSELAPHTSALLKKMVGDLFEPDLVRVIEGDHEVAGDLLRLPFDHVFFTGSPRVGKIIMRAASDHLAHVTLELGGKNPALIAKDASLADAAKKLTWGNFLNAGQSCVAVDYVLVPEELEDTFVEKVRDRIKEHYTGEASTTTFANIIDDKHWVRLNTILERSREEGLKVEIFGEPDRGRKFMPPVLVTGVRPDSYVMEEEIFGPILPVLSYNDLDEAIQFIRSLPKPLATYLFTRSRATRKKVEKETSSGALVVNDLVIQFANHNLPFGGVNNSGSGKAHGWYGFREFSNEKPVVRQRRGFTTIQLFYPPYTNLKKKLIDIAVKYL